MTKGYLYIAMGKRYLLEAEISARSLKRFTKFPICLVTDDGLYQNPVFDEIILIPAASDFVTKILGLVKTPYERTVFLDTDTFVCSSVDNLFEILDLFDMAMTIERGNHSYTFFERYNPSYTLRFENVLPEYHTGVIVYKMNNGVKKLYDDWLTVYNHIHVKADMPAFREAFILNATTVRIATLPFEYNYHGTLSFGFVHNEIKIIHDRLGEKWNTLTRKMLSFEQMNKISIRINKFCGKRIIVPYIGYIPYFFSPYRVKYKIKKMLGIKKTKKAETF